ncbi:hypothetical protein QR680_007105 [Steinernema hermaphroditum]|uniref:Uncharacterized protein n=1 Tax=Steinernema hermaphroditum TaxID=289476 RepID=A0AA39HZ71_9BILA|nr:hypothetical protein QR680_007105 [Steinernema hermaphroditum]
MYYYEILIILVFLSPAVLLSSHPNRNKRATLPRRARPALSVSAASAPASPATVPLALVVVGAVAILSALATWGIAKDNDVIKAIEHICDVKEEEDGHMHHNRIPCDGGSHR